jgi:hypothetical protein
MNAEAEGVERECSEVTGATELRQNQKSEWAEQVRTIDNFRSNSRSQTRYNSKRELLHYSMLPE